MNYYPYLKMTGTGKSWQSLDALFAKSLDPLGKDRYPVGSFLFNGNTAWKCQVVERAGSEWRKRRGKTLGSATRRSHT